MMNGNDITEMNSGNRTRSSVKRSTLLHGDGISNHSVDGRLNTANDESMEEAIIQRMNKEVERYKFIENLREAFVHFICEIRSLGYPFFDKGLSTVKAFDELVPK